MNNSNNNSNNNIHVLLLDLYSYLKLDKIKDVRISYLKEININ